MKIGAIADIIKKKFGNECKLFISNPDVEVSTLLTDSRNHFNPQVTLFFAIKTKGGNDGHKYIKELHSKGVRNFIVENLPQDFHELTDINLFVVSNSIDALTEIGQQHRDRAKEIVAITGSRGKTTVKELIFQLLEPYKTISRSPRSYNSKIGVPLSLWQISKGSDIALIEAGISKRGEMATHLNSIQPDTVIFTNIGEAHSHGFVSQDEKAKEKTLLALGDSVKTVIYPMDSKILDKYLNSLDKKKELIRWSFKNPEAELFISFNDDSLEYRWKNKRYQIEIHPDQDFDIENIANTLAFLLKEELTHDEIKKRFKNLHKINTRLNVSDGVNGCSVILDSYTSDLSSLIPAIDFMTRRKMPSQTLTMVISDLHHEVSAVDKTYREIAQIVKETGISRLIGIGELFFKYSELFPEGSKFYSNTEAFLKDFSLSDYNDEIILLKGSPEYDFKKIHEQLEAKKHETVLEVNLDSLLRNYNYFRSQIPSSTGIIAMVKASGYGAGSYEIAKTLQDAGASYLAVAALDEGIDLRKNGIVMPIMVMNPKAANYISLFNNRLEPVIFSISMLSTLISEASKYDLQEYPVHLKLDTGMHRMGFEEKDLNSLLALLKEAKNIKVESIFSHLATADCLDMDEYTHRQLTRFEDMSSRIISSLKYPVRRHILNSAGILRFPSFHYDLVRLGIGLYGANTLPSEIEKPLSTVLTLRSVILCVREVEGDEAIGYSRKGKIKGKARIATIPIGYADGMNRKFGNGSIKVLVNGHMVPTIGNICMDATMLDVTGIECKEGDSVEIFGESISVQTLADTLDTIPYEILTSISPRVKRIYYRE